VEHEHLSIWRQFRRALKQRNAALKTKSSTLVIKSWNSEFLALAGHLDESRRRVLDLTTGGLQEQGRALLQTELAFSYRQGWSRDKSLEASLEDDIERDLKLGSTQSGPHRADIKVSFDERQARKLVSRGQQKLLASAMILAATETAQAALERPLLLLLDDPAAELDSDSITRLIAAVAALGCQVVATSLDPEALIFPEAPVVFHVEQGVVSALEQ
jgi:DNA replication and repair protein RecF